MAWAQILAMHQRSLLLLSPPRKMNVHFRFTMIDLPSLPRTSSVNGMILRLCMTSRLKIPNICRGGIPWWTFLSWTYQTVSGTHWVSILLIRSLPGSARDARRKDSVLSSYPGTFSLRPVWCLYPIKCQTFLWKIKPSFNLAVIDKSQMTFLQTLASIHWPITYWMHLVYTVPSACLHIVSSLECIS